MRRVLLTAAAGAVVLAGCGGHTYDRAAHEEALEAEGVEVQDWGKLMSSIEQGCEGDAGTWALGMVDAGGEPEVARIHIEHVCPDKVGEVDAVFDQ